MVRAPEHHPEKPRTPLHIYKKGGGVRNSPGSNLKRNSPQSDSDWGNLSLESWIWGYLWDR